MKHAIGSISIAIAIIMASFFIGNSYKYKFKSQESISVTGLAEKDFESDQIVWTGSYNRKTMDLKEAYSLLKHDEQVIRAYLQNKQIQSREIVFSSVSINKEYQTRFDENGKETGRYFDGYTLSQSVTVDSRDIDKIEKVSREVTELIESGIEFNSAPPSYFYTRLSELKLDLLAKASADARKRAETIAKNSGSGLGKILNANMGVFQITATNGNEDYSYGGAFNTSSRYKTASVTTKIDYAVD
ncbi:SIMPL domain-containing protein [Rurimicrobium arvi]|uniref:SIMPL domain-containing protein n=1 Tax=Rurimicrobium arvi TaxID=2049916 RepID=A0ABP8MPS9_9BACT